MFMVNANQNFIRIFRLPEVYPEGYCFAGGHEVTFKLIDWFYPLDQTGFYNNQDVLLDGDMIEEHHVKIREFIKGKIYYNSQYAYLAITDYGDAFLI
jgi:hypothetical protein